ncbi:MULTISPECIES: hypothetical protein [unclassified Polaribacter]|uniref:hypothetical protein n=1 Tax=unclassified Polaribacter TaxID=196858 RepID=UPI001CB98B89|nr:MULTISPECIES: hypothetical protein [unclassified Polaribacter]
MKKIVLLFTFFYAIQIASQEKRGRPFFTGSSNFTFGINEFYTLDLDDGEPLIVPAAIFFRIGFGYEFKRRLAISVHGGYDSLELCYECISHLYRSKI